jgi:heme-degrading monooxygenase HmoA
MILEAAILQVRPGMQAEFEAAFRKASPIIASTHGYLGHELQKCLEAEAKYLLLVRWETLEDHTGGFRGSPEYQQWSLATILG